MKPARPVAMLQGHGHYGLEGSMRSRRALARGR